MGQKSRTKKAGQKVEQKMTDEQLGQKKNLQELGQERIKLYPKYVCHLLLCGG